MSLSESRFRLVLTSSWLWGALLLGGLATIGCFPGVRLASLFSDSNGLSPSFTALLQRSQVSFAEALLAGGLLAMAGGFLLKPFRPLKGRISSRLPVLIPLAGFALAELVQAGIFGQIPHITDATSHWFQSQIFAGGHLAAAEPPCLEAFYQHNVIFGANGLWHSKYFPGQALWLIWPLRLWMMPLAFGLFLAASGRILTRLFDRATAMLSTGLMALSPLLLLVSASFMSHITLLMWMALGWAFLLSSLDSSRPSRSAPWAAAAGFCAAMGLLTRPQDAVLWGALILACSIAPLLRRSDRGWPVIGGFILGTLPPLAFLLFWNHQLYGHMLASGYQFSGGQAVSKTPIIRDTLGFSDSFTPAKAVKQTFWVGLRLNQALLGWPAALLLLPPALCIPSIRRKNALLLLGAIWLYLPYFFFHYYGFELEARYCASSAPLLIVMLARLLIAAGRSASEAPDLRRTLAAWIAAGFLYAAIFYWPALIVPRYANNYEEATPRIHQEAVTAGLNLPAIVLLPDEGFGYSSGFIHVDPGLQNPILYARDLPDAEACLREAFPVHTLYRFQKAFNGAGDRFEAIP